MVWIKTDPAHKAFKIMLAPFSVLHNHGWLLPSHWKQGSASSLLPMKLALVGTCQGDQELSRE